MTNTKTELPQNLKNLYAHWRFHTNLEDEGLSTESVWKDEELRKDVHWFVNERLTIWKKKSEGMNPPFTEDPVLSKFRFCNIFREFDRQTIEFHTLLKPVQGDFDLWLLNMFFCRMVANPETVKKAGLLSFDQRSNEVVYEKLLHMQRPMYGTPYVFPISVIQRGPTPTRELFMTQYLPSVMHDVAREIKTWRRRSVFDGLPKVISNFKYELNFHWTEVLIDVAYQFPGYIDLFGQFPAGPGAIPTLSRINNTESPSQLVADLAKTYFDTTLTYKNQTLMLSAENWEGIGCEYRKYTNLKNGEGRRRLYVPKDK